MEDFYIDEFDPERVRSTLRQWGVCVIVRHFAPEQARAWKEELREWICAHSDGALRPNHKQWTDERLPHGPRYGMFQSLVSHAPAMWAMREALYPLFRDLLEERELMTSLDGASVYPPPRGGKTPDDWAHVDQTVQGIECVQGQVVLANSLAAFRCTPTSHLAHERILEICNKAGDTRNWLKFQKGNQLARVQELFDNALWQMPVHAPAGSVILWYSNTIHSATAGMPIRPSIAPLAATWAEGLRDTKGRPVRNFYDEDGWRAVVYICMRRKSEYSPAEVDRVRRAAEGGLTTNHWGTKVFSIPNRHVERKVPAMRRLLREPSLVATPLEQLSPLLRRLVGADEWDDAPGEVVAE